VTEVPLGLEYLDESLEREVLMRERPEGRFTDAAEQLAERGAAR
jgi:hypothetical protein